MSLVAAHSPAPTPNTNKTTSTTTQQASTTPPSQLYCPVQDKHEQPHPPPLPAPLRYASPACANRFYFGGVFLGLPPVLLLGLSALSPSAAPDSPGSYGRLSHRLFLVSVCLSSLYEYRTSSNPSTPTRFQVQVGGMRDSRRAVSV